MRLHLPSFISALRLFFSDSYEANLCQSFPHEKTCSGTSYRNLAKCRELRNYNPCRRPQQPCCAKTFSLFIFRAASGPRMYYLKLASHASVSTSTQQESNPPEEVTATPTYSTARLQGSVFYSRILHLHMVPVNRTVVLKIVGRLLQAVAAQSAHCGEA